MSSEEEIKQSLADQIGRQMGMVGVEEDEDLDNELETLIREKTKLTPLPQLAEGAQAFSFEGEFQSKLAVLAVRDETFFRRVEGLVRAEYFDNMSEATLVHIAADYHSRYKRLPERAEWSELLKDAKAEKIIREDDIPDIVETLKTILKAPIPPRDYAVDKVAAFAKNQAITQAYMQTIPLIEKGEHAKAEKIMQKAFATGAQAVVQDNDYWNSIESRTQYRRDVEAGIIQKNGITTGLPKLDKMLYHKGWGRKELSVVMGGAKKGKSTGLLHWAIQSSLAGYNVLYVTLEVAANIIMERMDANVSGVEMGDLSMKSNEVEKGVKDRAGMRKPGVLKVTEFASGMMTPTDLRKVIEFYRAQGIIFDLIVVDYADIMAAEIKTGNDINESKQVWLGLRAIAHDENAAVLTATQTNRSGFTADVAKAEHAADDFNKIRIADLVLSINRTDEEKTKGEARLYFAASRNQAGEFTLKITQELSKMRFMTGILEIS